MVIKIDFTPEETVEALREYAVAKGLLSNLRPITPKDYSLRLSDGAPAEEHVFIEYHSDGIAQERSSHGR